MQKIYYIICFLIINVALIAQNNNLKQRPENWAKPVHSKKIKNLNKLNDEVYRSAQPDEKGFAVLKKMGIKSVLNLREYHSDEDEIKKNDFVLYRIKMDAGDIKETDVIQALKYIKNATKPVLIHCWHGSDRTGLICAMYRIIFQGWTKKEAIDELKNGGYGFHKTYKNIPEFLNNVNVDKIKQKINE